MIMKHIESAVQKVRDLGYRPVYAALYGSQNYGLDVYSDDYQSDYDVKIVVMPSLHDMVFKGSQVSMSIEYEGGLIDIKDPISMTSIIAKMNPQYLEILQTPFYMVYPGGEYMEDLRDMLPQMLTERASLFAKASYGMFQTKISEAQKITPASEDKIRQFGYHGKPLHHALRLKLMLEDFEKTMKVVLHPSIQHLDLLAKLKRNEVPLDDAVTMSQQWWKDITDCANRIIATHGDPEGMSFEEAVHKTRQALYLALKSEAGIS